MAASCNARNSLGYGCLLWAGHRGDHDYDNHTNPLGPIHSFVGMDVGYENDYSVQTIEVIGSKGYEVIGILRNGVITWFVEPTQRYIDSCKDNSPSLGGQPQELTGREPSLSKNQKGLDIL